jgi:hypothetical protein
MKLAAYVFEQTQAFDHLAIEWWGKHHEGIKLHDVVLAKQGVIVFDEYKPAAIQYIYPAEGSDCAWLGFTVTNPNLSRYRAGKALQLLFETSEATVRQLGKSMLYTGFDHPALQKIAQRRGYIAGSVVKEYWRRL